jgi:hypothetical protein
MADPAAPCEKCKSKISVAATKCPECGYEPSAMGIGGVLLLIVTLPVFLFSVLIVLISPILLFSGTDLSTIAVSIGVFGFIALTSGGVLYLAYQSKDQKPATQES